MLTTEVKYTLVDDLSAKVAKIEARLSKFDKLIGHTDDNLKKLGKHGTGGFMDKLLPNNSKVEKITGALSEIPNLNMGILSSAGTLANPYVLAGAAVVAFGAYAVDSTRLANEWNKGMAKANVTIGETPEGLKRISEKLQQMPRYGNDMMTIPETFNQIISGTGDVNKSMDIMQFALKGARAGFTDLNTVADAGVNIMNSVGNKVSGAKEVYDVLFATLNKGKGEFKDIADYLPRIIPYSNQLGVSFKETSAMFALMTAKGQTTEQSTMLLQNAFISLLDGKKRGKMEQFVKVFDNGKIRPFANIVGDLSNKMKGMSDQQRVNLLDKLGLDAQAASAFSVLSQNADELKGFITYINNSSVGKGALEKALGDSKHAGDGVSRIKEKWDNLKMSLGQKIAPFWEKFTTGLADLWDKLERVEKKTGFFSTALTVLNNTVKLLFSPFVRLYKVINWVYDASSKVSSFLSNNFPLAFNIAMTPIRTITSLFKDLWYITTQTYDILAKLANFDFKGIKDNIVNMRNHDYAINGQQQYKLNSAEAKGMYDELVKNGVSKDKLNAWAKKWGIAIPGTAPKDVTPTNTGASLMPTSTGMGDDDKKKAKHKADRAEQGLREVAGGGAQVRNVTIHIGKQIEKVEIATTNLQNLSKEAIRKILEELMVTTVRDSEIMLAH